MSLIITGCVVGGFLLIGIIAGVIWSTSLNTEPTLADDSGSLTAESLADSLTEYHRPEFPELRNMIRINGVTAYDVKLNDSQDVPGRRMEIRVVLPKGADENSKIPCVLVAPAGTTLVHGSDIPDYSYKAEMMPYVDAGMMVIQYSLDGFISEQITNDTELVREMSSAFKEFNRANGGVTNGQLALDFAIARFPQLDQDRIYCAGHSSAGTLALQLASADKRIQRCVAYAPVSDLQERLGAITADPRIGPRFLNLKSYIKTWSPDQRIDQFHCPVMLFHARDDSNVRYASASQFVDKMKSADKDIHFVTARRGDHYQSMIDAGIPSAVNWLKEDSQ